MIIGQNVNKMILTNLTGGGASSLTFYGILPDEFTETHSTNFETIEIKSRSNPLASYASSSARTTDITVTIHEDYLAEFNGGTADIRDFIAQIKAITYPEYMGTQVAPPTVMLRIGNFFRIKGYCTNCSVTWKKPIRNDRYIVADVTFSIAEALLNSLTASQVIAKEDLRAM